MRAKLILAAALLVVPLAIAGYAIADSGGRNDAAEAQSATARYHDLQNALDDGYSELPAVQDTSTVKATNGCASSKLGAGAVAVRAGVQQDGPRTVSRWQRRRELRLDAARLDLDAEPDRGADALEPAGDLRERLIHRQGERSGARTPLEDRVAPGKGRPARHGRAPARPTTPA